MKSLKLILILMTLFFLSRSLWAEEAASIQEIAKEIGIDQNLNAQVAGDLLFKNELGQEVRLQDYLGKRPIILQLVFFKCPMLCPMTLSGLVSALRVLNLKAGEDFEILTVSFDPADTPQAALEKKEKTLSQYGRFDLSQGWHFLTGEKTAIESLTKAVGFRYLYDEKSGQFAHAGGLMVLTPEGKVSRYFYGIEYSPKDLRFSLIEASKGKIGTWVDQILLLCYHYDPVSGKYGLWIMGLLRVFGVATLGALAAFIGIMIHRDRNQKAGVR